MPGNADPVAVQGPPGEPFSVEDLSKTFATRDRTVTALDAVRMTAARRRVTGLVGPDGAGKTTLLRIAAGLIRPDAGEVSVGGIDALADPQAVQSAIGYMPQRFGLYEDLSVRENLDLYADLRGVARDTRSTRYDELMRMTGLADFQSRLAGRLSGGMKQKLGLACALVRTPPVLLLDEPTVGVDPVSRRELWEIIHHMVGDEGTTVVLSTAYLDEAERCHEVVLLHEGRVVEAGPPRDFYRDLAGRTFQVPAGGVSKRSLQRRMNRTPGVQDAVIQRDGVRVLLEARKPEQPEQESTVPGADWRPVPPRFEDAFVSLLGRPRLAHDAGASGARSGEGGTVIAVNGLSRRFGDFYAVRDVSFDVFAGEVFGLLGANGAGKSTTFRMLCGLLPASEGRLRVAGVDLRRAAARARARIGYMSQRFSLYRHLTVAQNMRFFAGAYNLRGEERRERMAWALSEFDLERYAAADAGTLSLGYQQRLALACALMHRPEILFLDEPTSGVDPLARREFWDRINGLAERGVTVLVTTHFLEEAEYCDRAAIMVAGRLLQLGTPEAIKAAARTAETPDPTMEQAFIHVIETAPGEQR